MTFLEQLLGFSPDGGSGATEIGYMVAAVSVVAVLVLVRLRSKRPPP